MDVIKSLVILGSILAFGGMFWRDESVILGCIMMVAGVCLLSVSFRHKAFGDITCARLNVVNREGAFRCVLCAEDDKGYLAVFDGSSPVVGVTSDDNGGMITVRAKNSPAKGLLFMSERGGTVHVTDSDGEQAITIGTDEYGGEIFVRDKNGEVWGLFRKQLDKQE